MRPLILLTVVGCIIGTGPPAAFAALSDWGYWSKLPTNPIGPTKGYQFDLTRGQLEWQTVWSQENNRITQHKIPTSASGAEWFDIELLAMDLVTKADNKTYLEWLLITSHAGVEPDEWAPVWNGSTPAGDTGLFKRGNGVYADERDGNNLNHPAGKNYQWNYRSNPVIGISLDGADAFYEWGLLLDSNEDNSLTYTNNAAQNNDWDGTNWNTGHPNANSPYVPGASPIPDRTQPYASALYKVNGADTWKDWIPPTDFPIVKVADLDTAHETFKASGTSTRAYGPDEGGYILGGTWRQDYNWVWEGSMDVTSLFNGGTGEFVPGPLTKVHYAMFCGNDFIEDEGGGFNLDYTPELPSGALLLLGMVPVGLAWLRRKRS